MRSRLGLVGNTLDVDGPSWERLDGGIGAGIDSYYEYLLKVCPIADTFQSCPEVVQLASAW